MLCQRWPEPLHAEWQAFEDLAGLGSGLKVGEWELTGGQPLTTL